MYAVRMRDLDQLKVTQAHVLLVAPQRTGDTGGLDAPLCLAVQVSSTTGAWSLILHAPLFV